MAQRRRKKVKPLNFQDAYGGDLGRMLQEMPDNFLECRDMMHSWIKRGVEEDKKAHLFIQTLACRRCTATKTRLVDSRNGELVVAQGIHRGYDYPPGYVVKGVGRMDSDRRGLVRLNSILRQI